jgi:IS605 OrfB family transposase
MTRAVRISLQATAAKRNRLAAMLRELRAAANFYAWSLWRQKGRLDRETMDRYQDGSLPQTLKAVALNAALQGVVNTKKAAKVTGRKAQCPKFKGAMLITDGRCRIEPGKGSFDFVMKLSSLKSSEPIVLPFNSHERLNYWLSKPGAKLCNSAFVKEDAAWVLVDLPDEPLKEHGKVIGLDTGFVKLITDSDGNQYGTEFRAVANKVRRCKPGSKGKRRARRARQHYVNFVCKRLPWKAAKTFVLEDLAGLKAGKGNRGKRNRKLLAPWTYRQVRTRLTALAQEHRVGLELVYPHGTSRRCPKCGLENAKNRVGEVFRCLRCNCTGDADWIGAVNILAKTTGPCPEPGSPVGTCGGSN